MRTRFLLLLLATLLAAPNVQADRRKYVWTYQYATIAPEATELELYQTTKLDRQDSWEYRIEIEHGLSPRWDISIYQIFAQKENESLTWDAFQLRTRYKLAEPGRFFFNPLLYLEYNRKTDLKAQNKLEGKLILNRVFSRVDLAFVPVIEYFWAPGEPKTEAGLDLGFSYEFTPRWSLGIEATSRREFVSDGDDETSSYVGPTVSFASSTVYYTIGYAWGVTEESDDARARFIMGIDL